MDTDAKVAGQLCMRGSGTCMYVYGSHLSVSSFFRAANSRIMGPI